MPMPITWVKPLFLFVVILVAVTMRKVAQCCCLIGNQHLSRGNQRWCVLSIMPGNGWSGSSLSMLRSPPATHNSLAFSPADLEGKDQKLD